MASVCLAITRFLWTKLLVLPDSTVIAFLICIWLTVAYQYAKTRGLLVGALIIFGAMTGTALAAYLTLRPIVLTVHYPDYLFNPLSIHVFPHDLPGHRGAVVFRIDILLTVEGSLLGGLVSLLITSLSSSKTGTGRLKAREEN